MVVNSDWTSFTRLILASQTGFNTAEVHSHRDNLLDTRLRDVLRQSPQSLQMSLSIHDAHDTVHPVDLARFTRVVPAILRTRKGVVVEQDSDPVFPGPRDRFGKVPVCQL
jgi:hypothetical protein